ncbi:MAG: D-glycerate dehydrogenase [Dehalococcoidia bacterium]|nr:D-glycerate dehydrogenase [Dehalococcoidia bacterium]
MERPAVVIALPLPDEALRRIAAACDVRRLPWPVGRAELRAALADAEGLLVSNQVPVDADLLAAAPRLRVLSGFGVGYDLFDVAAASARGVAVCNTPDVLSDAVADLTLALILALARRLFENAAYAREGWPARRPPPPLGWDLRGKVLGIVGMGRIGQAVARRARAFGMRILWFDTRPEAGDAAERAASLDALLAEADAVTLHVDLNPSTAGLIGERELARMKPTAVLVNTSRGAVIDQPALVAALRAGRIAGAALDVLETEPPAPDDPILRAPNLIILPHVGSATAETRAAMLDLAIENLLAVLGGRQPPACVNPEALPRALGR